MRRKRVTNLDPVLESIVPEMDLKASTSVQGADSICDGYVCTLDRTILMRSFGTSGVESATKLRKEGTNLRIGIDFTALVEMDIFVRASRRN